MSSAKEMYERILQKAITNPKDLTKREREIILNHKMSNEEVGKRIEEIHSDESEQASEESQDELWNGVYLRIINWDGLGGILKEELKSKFEIRRK